MAHETLLGGVKPRRVLRGALCLMAVTVLLGACGLIDDVLGVDPDEPAEPISSAQCDELVKGKPEGQLLSETGRHITSTSDTLLVRDHVLLPTPVRPPNVRSFSSGPGEWSNRYPPPRSFFPFECQGIIGAIWHSGNQDDVLVTVATKNFAETATWALPSDGGQLLAAAFGGGRFYYLTMGRAEGTTSADVAAVLTLHSYEIGVPTPDAYKLARLDTSSGEVGLNMIQASATWVGHSALSFSGDRIALVISRLMHRSSDGLNHQGATAAIFDAESLELTRLLGQTSGHSFGTFMTVAQNREFLAIDHGDNYPRGVHLHLISENGKKSRVVFTFKTAHGTTPQSPAGVTYPVFEEISNGTTYYQWSNDNNVYGELGAVIEFDDRFLVVFSGEPDAQGKALNNERAIGLLGDARNVGVVAVRKDFTPADWSARNVVTDDQVLSGGTGSITEEGYFYNFNGGHEPQRNSGLRWITHYTDLEEQNASRVKAVRYGDNAALVLWEVWSPTEFAGTYFAVIDKSGNVITSATEVSSAGGAVRLSRVDAPLVSGNRAYLFRGSGRRALEVVAIELEGSP